MILQSSEAYQVLTTSAALATNNVVAQPIRRQRRRLDGILIRVQFSSITSLASPTTDSFGAILKRIRLKVNDGSLRNMVDVHGPSLLDFVMRSGCSVGAQNVISWGSTSTSVGTHVVYYFVPLRVLGLEDPSGILTGLPLWALNEDPILEIDTGAAADMYGTFTLSGSVTIAAQFLYREEQSQVSDYIATELRTDEAASLSTSSFVSRDIPSGGALLALGLIGYSDSNLRTRAEPVSSTGLIQLQYGRETRRQAPTIEFIAEQTSLDSGIRVSSYAVNNGGGLWNFLDDRPTVGAFSAGSALNLKPIQEGGDLCQIQLTQTASSGTPGIRYTYLKAVSGDLSKIKFG